MKQAGKMEKLSGRTIVYQPLSSASIQLIRENQKFLDFTHFSTLVGPMLQRLPR